MDTTYVIQTKKQNLVSDTLTDLAKEDSLSHGLSCQPTDQLPCNVNDEERREDLNGDAKQNSPETPPTNNDPCSPAAAEQNSSGFGDEIGPDEEHKSNDSESDEENGNLFPSIFQTDNLTHAERLQAYASIFLAKSESWDDRSFDIHQELYLFLTEAVVNFWTGIWKVENNCDVVIETDYAPHPESRQQHLKAKVHISEPFLCMVDGALCTEEKSGERDEVERKIRGILEKSEGLVDLTDLYPVYNKTGLLDNTALAIEHARFFYQNLWRPMDDEDDLSGSKYMDKYLKPRLKFVYDVKEKRIPAHIVRKHQMALSECLDKYDRIASLQAQLEDGDGSEGGVDELDMNESCMVVDIMGLNEEIEVLKMKMEKLENPVLRSLMDIPNAMLLERSTLGSQSREDSSPKTFLVTKTLTAGMIQNLNLGPDVVLEHCRSPGEALSRSYNSDTILIFPGSYTGERFYTLQHSVTIKGVGKREDIIIRCEELADIFLDCDASGAMISNLTLQDDNSATSEGLIAVRAGGSLMMNGCLLQSGGTGVNVFRGGSLEMTGCEIKDIQRNGLRCKAGSSVIISDTNIHRCGLHQLAEEDGSDVTDITKDSLTAGIMVEIQESDEKDDKTTLTLVDTKVYDNHGAGMALLVGSNKEEEPEPITTDVIELISGVNVLDMKNNDFKDNLLGDAMLARFVDD
ncbi:SHC SH2 domain-binding protein 1-like [Lytechinus variegatus]|uniref:SHC SH2 domain-binding protein 1-like n=1 Tax=Lytechinus variegatus TaxID=7654 RepID=UPI001BB15026|nr:SHC SH2 domain-binding protein 1-like [Lytechinus variegatus]